MIFGNKKPDTHKPDGTKPSSPEKPMTPPGAQGNDDVTDKPQLDRQEEPKELIEPKDSFDDAGDKPQANEQRKPKEGSDGVIDKPQANRQEKSEELVKPQDRFKKIVPNSSNIKLNSNRGKALPKTGDGLNTNVYMYVLSLLGILMLLIGNRQRKRDK